MNQVLPLNSLTVAVVEHRFAKEFSILFEKLGANVIACPLLREAGVENNAELQHFVKLTASRHFDAIVFLTGVGATMLICEAEAMGLKQNFLEALRRATIITRGSKPATCLRQFGTRVDIVSRQPTTEGVIERLQAENLHGKRIGVQLYGTPNPQLVSALQAQGAEITQIQVYSYAPASDRGAVHDFIRSLTTGRIDVVPFTSAPQVRMLFEAAREIGMVDALREAFNEEIAVASVGEVTTRELASRGIKVPIEPKQPKMGPMALAVAAYFAGRTA